MKSNRPYKIELAALLAIVLSVAAAKQVHAESVYSQLDVGTLNTSVSSSPTIAKFTLGYQAHPNVAIEGATFFTVSEGYGSRYVEPSRVGVERAYAVYLKPSVDLNKNLTLFGRVGAVTGTTYEVFPNHGNYKMNSRDTLRSVGAGAEFKLNREWSLTADYMTYGDNMDGFSVGAKFKFK
jgi:hypothetical protein